MSIKVSGNHLAGGKITRSHSTVIDAARDIVRELNKLDAVTKIVLGMITPRLPVGRKMMKVLPIVGGVKVVVRGVNSKQELWVYTQDCGEVERLVKDMI